MPQKPQVDPERRAAILAEQCDVSYLLWIEPARRLWQYVEAMHEWTVEEQARHRDALMAEVRANDRFL